jgi:hypothetical protein
VRVLRRVIKESKSQVRLGDAVGVRITPANLSPRQDLQPLGDRASDLHRSTTARRAGKDGATVTGSYLLTTGAEMLARVQYSDEETRRRFVAKVRDAAGIALRPFEQHTPETPDDPTSEKRLTQQQHANTPVCDGFPRE